MPFKFAAAFVVGIVIATIFESVFLGFLAAGAVMYLGFKHSKEFNEVANGLKQAVDSVKQVQEKPGQKPAHSGKDRFLPKNDGAP